MTWRLANARGRAALVVGDGLYDLHRHSGGRFSSDPMEAIRHHEGLGAIAADLQGVTPDGPVIPADLGPPVPSPSKCFGIGLNYRSHAAESNMELPGVPLVFTKFPNCLAGPTADIVLSGDGVDWEVELVVVIGRRCRDVAEADAWSVVAGFTAGQDISDRQVQFAVKPPQFSLGKSFDTYGPIGPVVASLDSFADPADVRLSCDVSGERMQEASTTDLIFDVPALVAYLSGICTLEPGELIFTGTPEGVGMSRGRLLRDGDVVTSTIDGIGTMTNVCRGV
jgi:2,4-didehydro-3-deoxy-L-rhamnonate hydrolase